MHVIADTHCAPRLALALVCGATLFAAPAADAATRLLAPGGTDSGTCTAAPCASLSYAYGQAASGDAIELAGGGYGPQALPAGTKAVTVRPAAGGTPDLEELRTLSSGIFVQGLKMRALRIAGGTGTVFDGIDVDGRFAKNLALDHSGSATNITVRNSRVGNVTDEKGAIVGDGGLTIDNVTFHDVLVTHSSVHNECVFATGAEGLTVRNSRFYNCATMDLFFTNWAGGPDYGNVTLENNVFGHSMMDTPGDWHYYSLNVFQTGPSGALTNWVVRNNTFEIDATIQLTSNSGSRWVGNLGGWNCVSGIEYRFNVGKRCGTTDKAVSPDSSTRTAPAPFGWADPPNQDFRLTAGSPAIDAADPADAPATDRDGYRRDARPDAGAHEFGAGPPAPPPTAGPPVPRAAPRIATARLRPRTICRRGCTRAARLSVRLSTAAKLSVTVSRAGKTRRARTLSRRTRHTLAIRARGLRAGRYRVSVVAVAADGTRSRARTFRLRIR